MKLGTSRLFTLFSALLTLSFTSLPPLAHAEEETGNNPDKTCPEPGEEGEDPEEEKDPCESCQSGDSDCPPGSPESGNSTPETEVPTGDDEECDEGTGAGIPGGGGPSRARARSLGSPTLYPGCISTTNISIRGTGQEIIRDGNTGIRQIRTRTALTDFQMEGPGRMVVRLYNIADIGGKYAGVYFLKEGAEPFKINTFIETEDGKGYMVNAVDKTAAYPSEEAVETRESYNAATNTKTLSKTWYKVNNGSQTAFKKTTTDITPLDNGLPGAESYLCTVQELGSDGQWYVVERTKGERATFSEAKGAVHLYKCDAVNEDGTPIAGISTENRYTYYTDRLDISSYGKVKTLRRNDGYWENRYYAENANAGLRTYKVESPWLDTPAHEPGTSSQGLIRVRTRVSCSTDSGVEDITEKVGDAIISKEWTEKSPVDRDKVKLVRHQPHAGGDKVTTTVRYRKAKDVPEYLKGLPVSIHNADGSRELYSYSYDEETRLLTATRDSGYGTGGSVTRGLRTVTVRQAEKTHLREETRYALEGGQAHWLDSRAGVEFDNAGYCLKWIYNNDPEDYTQEVKDCCRVSQSRGRDGVMTYYAYDPNGRKISTTTRGITTGTDYKGLVTVNWKQAAGSTQKYLLERTEKNLAGQEIRRTDPVVGGKTAETLYTYDMAARTTGTTTPYGTTRNSLKYVDGRKKSETGTTGITTAYAYTPRSGTGGGETVVAADGSRTATTSLDQLGNTLSESMGDDIVTHYTYDMAGRIKSRTLPDGERNLWEYGSDGVTVEGTDCDGDGVLSPSVDRMQKMERVYDSAWPENKGSWKTISFRAWHGNWKETVLSWATEDGTLTRRQIPGLAGEEVVEQPSLAQRGNNYTVRTTVPAGQTLEMAYALNNGMVTGVTVTWKDAAGNRVAASESTQDVWGHKLTSTDARTGTTTYTSDEETGMLLNETAPGNLTTSYQYDNWGRRVTTVLPDGTRQHTAYDTEGRITRQWGSQLYPVGYEYDAHGRKTGMLTYRTPVGETADWPEGAEGDRTTWVYETVSGNLIRKTYADGKGMTYTYTPGGKLKTQTNARGHVTTYAYSGTGELLSTTVNDGGVTPAQSYTYDQWGRQTSAVTAGVASWTYSYNDLGQTSGEEVTIPAANGELVRRLERAYDSYGRTTGYQLKHGDTTEQTVTYAYDAMGRMSGVTADGKEFTYDYMTNAPHLLSQVTSPVHRVENTYETTRDLLSTKTNKWKNKANTPVISAYAYTVNNLGQRTSVTTSGEAYTAAPADRVWMYDALGQVVSANEDRYAYDRIGNRTSTQKGTEQALNYEANALNQYASIGSTAPTYDADGNLLTGLQPVAALPERNQLTFTYNAQNRPIQIKQGGTVRENYTYDHEGRRIQKGDTLTLYDGYNAIAEYNLHTRILKTTYAWGMDISGTLQNAGGVGGLLSVTDHTTQISVISYPTYDGNGNITEYLTEENSGLLVAHYEYNAFGNVARKTGNKEFAYQFSTKPYDSFTGLNYYNYRNYDPCEGRWINRDPIEEEGGINLYYFLNNNSISRYDLLGKEDFECKEENLGQISSISFKMNYIVGTHEGTVEDPLQSLKDYAWDFAKDKGKEQGSKYSKILFNLSEADKIFSPAKAPMKAVANAYQSMGYYLSYLSVELKAQCCVCENGNYSKSDIKASYESTEMIALGVNDSAEKLTEHTFSVMKNASEQLRNACD